MPVETPHADYRVFAPKWERMRDCVGGRDAILAAGVKYAPDLPGSNDAGNRQYRMRGNFFNAVQRTVFGMVGLLFSKDMSVKFPPRLSALGLLSDATLSSVSAEMFAFTAANETLLIGRYGALVDMDDKDVSETGRPYVVGYVAEDIINWSVEQYDADGVLSRVVLRETYEETDPKDEFVQITSTQYRVLSMESGIYSQQLWRKPNGADIFVRYGEPIVPVRRGVPLMFIPFVFLGPLHVSSDLVNPPLLDLADVNLGHWRNSVDYEHGLHLVALPTPWVSGLKASTSDGPLKIGPSVVWELDVQGSAGMLEFQGTGLKAIVDAMDDKKRQMASLGARLLEEEPRYGETATGVAMRHAGDHATMKTLAIAIGQGLSMAFQMMAWWMGTMKSPKDEDVAVELNKDFMNVKISAQDVQAATAVMQAGKMSFETFWHLLSAGGWGRDGVTADDELRQIQKEEPVVPEVEPADVLNADGSTTHGDGSLTLADGTAVPASGAAA